MVSTEETVTVQLARLRDALERSDSSAFASHVLAFVNSWQHERDQMESNNTFVDVQLMQHIVKAIGVPELSWYALKLGCLMARADANAFALLRAGGVTSALQTLRAEWADESVSRVEVALALLQNVAYSNQGVASILQAGGVSTVLTVMSEHSHSVGVQKNGLGVLWNLCDSDEHWAAFLKEGPSMAAVLLATMQHHPDDRRIEESVVDMLWDVSSTGDGQAHILAAGGVPPILHVMRSGHEDAEFQKKALSMLWNLTISANGISAVVRHDGVSVVLEVMSAHAGSEEVQRNPPRDRRATAARPPRYRHSTAI